MKRSRILAAGLLMAGVSLAAAGCGSAPATVDGTVLGSTFEPAAAISTVSHDGQSTLGYVILSSAAGACDLARSNTLEKGMAALGITLGVADPVSQRETAPTKPGVFTIIDANKTPSGGGASVNFALVNFVRLDASCQGIDENEAVGASGRVTLTAIGSDGSYTGSGNVTFENGDQLTFTFDSEACGPLADGPAGTPKCQ